MTNLISDLLSYNRTLNVQEQYVITNLAEIVENIKSDLEIAILESKAVIYYNDLPVIKAVPSQISRLFFNLISNSIKFSKKDKHPVIKISWKKSPPFIEIELSDNGIGFNQEYAEKVFNLFQRLHDRKFYKGNGMGLSLCKKIVEAHKGEIYAEAQENKGSTFYIKFPESLLVE